MGVHTGVNVYKSAIACMWKATTPFPKMKITACVSYKSVSVGDECHFASVSVILVRMDPHPR